MSFHIQRYLTSVSYSIVEDLVSYLFSKLSCKSDRETSFFRRIGVTVKLYQQP